MGEEREWKGVNCSTTNYMYLQVRNAVCHVASHPRCKKAGKYLDPESDPVAYASVEPLPGPRRFNCRIGDNLLKRFKLNEHFN